MTLEKWYDYPKAYDVVHDKIFFDELKENLVKVIYDYAGLGVEDEAEIAARANSLFNSQVVPTKRDWIELENILNILTQKKEFTEIWNSLFEEAKDILDINDLDRIREFLDRVQTLGPVLEPLIPTIPAPNITRLTKPLVSSTNNYQTSVLLRWDIDRNTLTFKTGAIVGQKAPNEDITGYDLIIKAGTYNHTEKFDKTVKNIHHSLTLDWWKWFGKNINNANMDITLKAKDKRGNEGTQNTIFRYPNSTKMQAPIKSYKIEYKIGSGNWTHIGTSEDRSYIWTTLPKVTGSYTFRVRGKDEIDEYTPWSESDPVWMQYIDYSLVAPRVTGNPSLYSITATWTHVDKAEYYDIWIGDEATAKRDHKSYQTRWITQRATETRRVIFGSLNSSTSYKISVRARNIRNQATGYTYTRTLSPAPRPPRVVAPPRRPVTKTYTPTGNQVYNWGYTMLTGINSPYGRKYGPHWHNGGNGSSTGVYQGEWVDGRWTGEQNWAGYTWRGGWSYRAWDGQHWGNRMSFIYYDYNQMRRDMKGKTVKRVVITAKRRNTVHGHMKAYPLHLYNHKREFTTNTGTSTTSTGGSTSGAQYYTVKQGDYLYKIAQMYNTTVDKIKQWNNLTSNYIYVGNRLKVSEGTGRSTPSRTVTSDNSLTLYTTSRSRLTQSNQSTAYDWPTSRGNTVTIDNATTVRLVNNIANGDMKGIGLFKFYGPNYNSPAGYNNHDTAYMSFEKGTFTLQVTYE